MSDAQSRYEEIMRRLAARKTEQAVTQVRLELGPVLDAVDAYGKLEKLRASKAMRKRCFGPKVCSGLAPAPWTGVIVWRRGTGYYGYKVLTLAGVWAYEQGDEILLTVGAKHAAYSAPTYEAEAYAKLMRKDYSIYYRDDGSPPPAHLRHLTVRYDPAQRLQIREQVWKALTAWAGATV